MKRDLLSNSENRYVFAYMSHEITICDAGMALVTTRYLQAASMARKHPRWLGVLPCSALRRMQA